MSRMVQSRSEKITGALNDAIKGTQKAVEILSAGNNLLDAERVIWEAYGRAEYAIFALKLETGEGVAPTVKKARIGTENFSEAVDQAVKELQAGLDAYNASRFSEALGLARSARNSLRNLLGETRKLRKKPLLSPTPQTPPAPQ